MNKARLVASTMTQGEFRIGINDHFDFDAGTYQMAPVSRTSADDDKTSSIRNDNKFSITFCRENDYKGAFITIKAHEKIENLSTHRSPVELNDKISSRQPRVASGAGERAAVSVCTQSELRGECQGLDISQMKIGEEISSWQPEASDNTVPTYPN
ncbi:hypothetical protein [Streptomyces sp. NPDC058394]|uniref:hypothetical protein n=1 Tax=Streptomyces sp. NPDC058394 TaxID=3346477 RepID=UPI003659BFF2